MRLCTLLVVFLVASSAHAQLRGVAASHVDRDGPIAAWTESDLFVSRDGGATFSTLPMPVGNVRDVVIEEDGSLVALGGTPMGEEARLARVHTDGRVEPIATPAVPAADHGWVSAIASEGALLVALLPYEGAVAWSRGGGAWQTRVVRSGGISIEATLALDRDGTLHVVDVAVDTCGSSDILEWAVALTVTPQGGARAERLPVAVTDTIYPTRWVAAPRGWIYAEDEDGALFALSHGARRRVPAPATPTVAGGWSPRVRGNGALTLAQIGDALVELRGLRAHALATLPDDVALADVDARGRALAMGDHTLRRYSRRTGWETLPLP